MPWVLGLIATRSLDEQVPGIDELVEDTQGAHPPAASLPTPRCKAVRTDPTDADKRAAFEQHAGDLGYGLLLKRYVRDPAQARPRR